MRGYGGVTTATSPFVAANFTPLPMRLVGVPESTLNGLALLPLMLFAAGCTLLGKPTRVQQR